MTSQFYAYLLCAAPMMILVGYYAIKVCLRIRKWKQMKLLAMLGTPICEMCEVARAECSDLVLKDDEYQKRFCQECLRIIVRARSWETSYDGLLKDIVALRGDLRRALGNNTKYTKSVTIRQTLKKSSRRA